MSPEMVTAGGVAESSQPRSTPYEGDESLLVRYRVPEAVWTFSVITSPRPPEDLLLNVEMSFENQVVYMRAVEVDISTEGETPQEALQGLVGGIKEWLEFLREEQPELVADLEEQRRYVNLLRYSPDTWFKSVHII
jgi:hypothetical protein